MIGALKTVSVYVEDQQRAMEFYVGKLGFVIGDIAFALLCRH